MRHWLTGDETDKWGTCAVSKENSNGRGNEGSESGTRVIGACNIQPETQRTHTADNDSKSSPVDSGVYSHRETPRPVDQLQTYKKAPTYVPEGTIRGWHRDAVSSNFTARASVDDILPFHWPEDNRRRTAWKLEQWSLEGEKGRAKFEKLTHLESRSRDKRVHLGVLSLKHSRVGHEPGSCNQLSSSS
ncbi:hypothetical protein C8R44DRAFT_753800 [Mycena epipterygia]|nr:hypothetical protein C8R44DRAFT_753800 [Mycena epipterygia]